MSPRAFLWALPLGVVLWLGIFLVVAHAADWMMVVCRPGQLCEVRMIYWDAPAGIVCATDSVGVAIVSPPGTRIDCKRLVPAAEAKR